MGKNIRVHKRMERTISKFNKYCNECDNILDKDNIEDDKINCDYISANYIGYDSYRNTRYPYKDSDQSLVIDLLLKYGYQLNYEDVKSALQKKIIIKNIERYNVKFDETYFYICSKIGYYPYTLKNIFPDITCLVNECEKAKNDTFIKKLIEEYNIVPNVECIQRACKLKNNSKTINLLISKGSKVDFTCLKNIMNGYYYNNTISLLLQTFEKDNTITLKDNNVVKEEHKINLLSENENKTNIISIIPSNIRATDNFYHKIPIELIKLLKLNKASNENLSYLDFRKEMLNYLRENKLIDNKNIILREPFLFKGNKSVQITEINEWIYSLLFNNDKDTKNNDIILQILYDAQSNENISTNKNEIASIPNIDDDGIENIELIKRRMRRATAAFRRRSIGSR